MTRRPTPREGSGVERSNHPRYQPGPRVLARCDPRTSGRAIGAHIVARHVAGDPQLCQCCRCLIEAGDTIYEAVDRDGWLLDVCSDCRGPR
jgi:hypothetical protein